MRLRELLNGINIKTLYNRKDMMIKGISYDSRKVQPGFLFVAIKGNKVDGHEFINDAIKRGASAIVGEGFVEPSKSVTFIEVNNSREALSVISSNYYNRPYKELEIIGITGTNGKTTTTYLIESILKNAGYSTGVIGTVEYRFSGKSYPAPVTTPESLELMGILRQMADAGVKYVIMEVSSHAISQKRIWSCPFRVGAFTNLSRDHLDYHLDMENYFKAKAELFEHLSRIEDYPGARWAVINMDDPWGERIKEITTVPVVLYGTKEGMDVSAEDVRIDMSGIRGMLVIEGKTAPFVSPLTGAVNLYNILCASAVSSCIGLEIEEISAGLREVEKIPGRMELIRTEQGFNVIIDYAHTPDALLKVLESIGSLSNGRIITLFGCGGDRDRGKRAEMGEVAMKLSDVVIITSDNPRSEDPISIISEIERGVKLSGVKRIEWNENISLPDKCYFIEPDRRKAIQMAVCMADRGDTVLIAGKGHENYQIIGDKKIPFDDREEALRAISYIEKEQ